MLIDQTSEILLRDRPSVATTGGGTAGRPDIQETHLRSRPTVTTGVGKEVEEGAGGEKQQSRLPRRLPLQQLESLHSFCKSEYQSLVLWLTLPSMLHLVRTLVEQLQEQLVQVLERGQEEHLVARSLLESWKVLFHSWVTALGGAVGATFGGALEDVWRNGPWRMVV